MADPIFTEDLPLPPGVVVTPGHLVQPVDPAHAPVFSDRILRYTEVAVVHRGEAVADVVEILSEHGKDSAVARDGDNPSGATPMVVPDVVDPVAAV